MKVRLFPAVGALIISGVSLSASPIFLTSVGSLGPNDQINWSQLGSVGTNFSSPASATSNDGLTVTVSNGDAFTIYQEANTWFGNFTDGDILLGQSLSDIGSTNDPLALSFGMGVYGAGFQVQAEAYGSFTVQLAVYNTSNILLGSHTYTGVSNGNDDGSAIFVGALDTTADIGQVWLTLTSEGGSAPTTGFAVDTAFVSDTLPEPGSVGLILSGLACLTLFHRCRRNS